MGSHLKRPGIESWNWLSQGWSYGLVILSSLGCIFIPTVGRAASEIVVSYGSFERSVAITDLEQFAQTGELSPQLQAYNRQLQWSQDQLNQSRQVLVTPAQNLDVVAVSQFLYTEQGEILLRELTRVVQAPAHQASFSALRAALILAASSHANAFTLLNVLRSYPLDTIRIDLMGGLAIVQEVNQAILQSGQAVARVEAIAKQEAEANPLSPGVFRSLQQMIQDDHRYRVEQYDLAIPGVSKPATLFLPEAKTKVDLPDSGFPVVIISHGLGGSNHSYSYLAQDLAATGIAVVNLEHSGSNGQQLNNLLKGKTDSIVPTTEFLRRPEDVSLTITALTKARLTRPELLGGLNMQQVGVIGQSLGGYTALALAGASFDQAGLTQYCPADRITFNPSLLLQCQAAHLGSLNPTLADPRVKAIFTISSIGSVLFGRSGYGRITIPTMMVASALDTIAPAFPEQIQPFSWLTNSNHYLLLMHKGTHFSGIGDGDVSGSDQALAIPRDIIGPRPDLAQKYIKVFAQAFFKLTLSGDERFRSLLQPSFAQQLGETSFPLSLTTNLPSDRN
ncbi:MAG: alpha/beta hydrolase [Nodosilinea sp. LVE1205-7]|jgi:predicted dienelactone hydrolase